MDLTSFISWQAESPATRRVNINIQPDLREDIQRINIWVSDDYVKHSGHFVTCVEDIDLMGAARRYDMAEMERIRERYKGAEG